MSASTFLFFGSSIIRHRKPLFLPFSPPHLLASKPFPSLSLRFRRYTSSAAALDTVNADTTQPLDSASQPHHPWPEWVTFIDRLKSKGYLVARNDAATSTSSAGNEYKDMNFLKDACLSFARDRFDLFKLRVLSLFQFPFLLRINSKFYLLVVLFLIFSVICILPMKKLLK